ncbi:MAG: ice-binding family protein [Candidatus Parcubacteria bacterium]|nr:ice-binding family protein [Candidatus Parcubacteria bacterium]
MKKTLRVSLSVLVSVLALGASAPLALAATAPTLGSISTYGVVSSTFTNSNTAPQTIVDGSVCYTTGPDIPPVTMTGAVGACPGAAGTDQDTALNGVGGLNTQACPSIGADVALDSFDTDGAGPILPGTFPPGCYSSTGAMNITTGTTVTLDGSGVYIFRPGGALNTGDNSNVSLVNGASASNVFWAPVGATILGAYTTGGIPPTSPTFVGNIFRGVADGLSITLGHFASLLGRALAFGSTVTTDANTITVPPAASVCTDTCYVNDATGNDTYSGISADTAKQTILAAITQVSSSGTVNVAAGDYSGPLTINKAITLQGNPGTNFTGQITIASDNVTIDGMDITNPTAGYGIVINGKSNVFITGNTIHDIGTSLTSGSAQAIDLVGGSSAAISGVSITGNIISNIGSSMLAYDGSSGSAKGIFIGDTAGTGTITGLTISNNHISNVFASTTPWANGDKFGRGAYGVLVNFGGSHANGSTAATISANTINNLSGFWAHAIGLEGNTPNTTVSDNTVTNLSDNKGGTDAMALRLEDNVSGPTVTGTGNTLGGVPLVVGNSNVIVDQSISVITGTTYPETLLNGAYYYIGANATSTVQGGVSLVTSGGTVHVAAGTYNEHDITINKSLTLTGDVGDAQPGPGANAPVIDGQDLWSDGFLLSNGVSNVTIQGFEIRNYIGTGNGVGNAIQAWVASTDHITVNDNYMHNLSWNGVLVGNDGAIGDHSYWTITRNRLTDFGPTGAFANSGYGLELTNTSHGVIEDNVIDGGTHFPGVGILVTMRRLSGQDMLIQRNSVRGQFDNSGIYVGGFGYDVPNNNLDDVRVLNNDVDISGTAPRALRVLDNSTGTVTNVVVHDNKLIMAGGYGIANQTAVTSLNATNNWWGSAVESTILLKISGNVNYKPWYTDSSMTTLRYATMIDGNGNLTITPDPVTITATEDGDVGIVIPSDMTITGPAGWTGDLILPTITTTTVTVPSFDTFVTSAVTVGSNLFDLTFDKAVKLTFAGQAGTLAGWYDHANNFHEITATCAANDQTTGDALDPGTSCKINVGAVPGGDLVVWTKHFSTFVTYTQTPKAATPPSSGHGGGGGPGCAVGTAYNPSTSSCTPVGATPATPAVPGVSPAIPATPSQGRVLGAATFNFTRNLGVGLSGEDVTALQQILIDAGLLKINAPTGNFGQLTKAAVQAFQKSRGVSQTGFVGPLTRGELNSGSASSGVTVEQMNAILTVLQSFDVGQAIIDKVRAALAR